MNYATVEDVEAGFRALTDTEKNVAAALIEESAVIIDAYNAEANDDSKRVVTCRMVRRAIGENSGNSFPIGATQGSISALGYSQSWTNSNGTSGELYLSKMEKKLLGVGNHIGSYSPVEEMAAKND